MVYIQMAKNLMPILKLKEGIISNIRECLCTDRKQGKWSRGNHPRCFYLFLWFSWHCLGASSRFKLRDLPWLFSSLSYKCQNMGISTLSSYHKYLHVITMMFYKRCAYWLILTLFRMGFSGAPSLKSVTHIQQWWNVAQLYLTQRRSKKYMNQVTHPLSSPDISIFSPEISKFRYIKKYRYSLYFGT